MTHFTLEELKDAIQKLPFFGEALLEIHKKENSETLISILDEEQERFIDSAGDIVEGEYRRVTKMAMMRIDAQGTVLSIEEPYETIVKNNDTYINLLLSFVGSVIALK